MGRSALADFTAGTVGGAAMLVTGHPFDTIKVKLQSQPKALPGQAQLYSSALDAVSKTVKEAGVTGFFKGMGAPLATVALFNAVLFATRGQMEQLLAHDDGTPFTAGDQFVAGSGAGAAAAFLACPTELVKCRLQAQSHEASVNPGQPPKRRWAGPIDLGRHVWRHEGGLRGIYKGMVPTLCREVPGSAVMFGAYEWVKIELARRQGLDSITQLGLGSMVLAGGIAGTCYWIPVYPADIVKSRIQVDDFSNPQYRGTWDCAKQMYAGGGLRGFYKGFDVAMLRSFPANAACFVAYEAATRLMSRN